MDHHKGMPNSSDKTERPKPKEVHYYFENGLLVMTEAFHLERGYCCGSRCKHCPFDHVNVKP